MAKKRKKSQKADGKKASGIKQPTNTGVDGNPNVGTIAEEQANIQVAQIPVNPVDSEDASPLGDTYHRGPVILRGQMIPSDNTTANLLKPDQDTDWLHMDPWRVLRIQSEFVDGFGALAELGPAVSIFGSARTTHRIGLQGGSSHGQPDRQAQYRRHHWWRAGHYGSREQGSGIGGRQVGGAWHRTSV